MAWYYQRKKYEIQTELEDRSRGGRIGERQGR